MDEIGRIGAKVSSTSYKLSKRKRIIWILLKDRVLEQELLDEVTGTLTEQKLNFGFRFER